MLKRTDPKRLIELEKKVLVQTYMRPEVVFTRGEGPYLYDTEGKAWLDFVSGIAVNAFGHCDPELQKVLNDQAARLWHCSNLYYTEPQIRLAKLLTDRSFADRVFFSNSGSEAMEGAIKFARKWAEGEKGLKSPEIISFEQSFHGRTMGALSATGQRKYWQGYEPMLSGFRFANFNDLDSVERAVTRKTAAVIAEPVQGEGGVHPASKPFLRGLRKLCDSRGMLLILDEIQCGLGRTGTLFACEQFGIAPDIAAIAKPIAGGMPMGAVLVTNAVAEYIKPGNHGSTFGGNPLVAAVAENAIGRIAKQSFLDRVKANGRYLLESLGRLKKRLPEMTTFRGMGLMAGADFSLDAKSVIEACFKNGLLLSRAGENTVRILPPLVVKKKQIDEFIVKLERAVRSLRG